MGEPLRSEKESVVRVLHSSRISLTTNDLSIGNPEMCKMSISAGGALVHISRVGCFSMRRLLFRTARAESI